MNLQSQTSYGFINARILSIDEKILYSSCSVCKKKVFEDIICCQDAEKVAKFMVKAFVSDKSGSAFVTFFGDEAQSLLGITLNEVIQCEVDVIKNLLKNLEESKFISKVRYSQLQKRERTNDETEKSFISITSMLPLFFFKS